MIKILCHHDYVAHRQLIREHLKHIVQLLGHRMLYEIDHRIMVVFPTMVSALKALNWTMQQRMEEWIQVAATVPLDEYFVANRFFSHLSIIRMEMDNLETVLGEGKLDEAKDAIRIMQYPADVVIRCMEIISSVEGRKYLPTCGLWKCPRFYRQMGGGLLVRYNKAKRDVDTLNLLRQGDALLALATDRVKEEDEDSFNFQAMLALESYRAAYQVCIKYVHVNMELEGLCLWSMGRVMGKYLGLEEHAYKLYFRGVEMVGMVSALLPTGEWYTDAVEKIQEHRHKLEKEENQSREKERAGILEQLAVELFELHSRAESVFDENSLRQFFRWLLRTYRPPNSSNTQVGGERFEAGKLSKVVLNVIGVYHVSEKDNCDGLWIVFSEEIVKVLSYLIALILDGQSLFWELRSCVFWSYMK